MADYKPVPTSEEDNAGTEASPVVQNDSSTTVTPSPPTAQYKVYNRRWVILFLFVMHSMSNGVHWIQYSIIANIVQKYYMVDSYAVDWTSMIFMVTYIPLVFPASWILSRIGLRWCVIVGALGTCVGSWIKVASVSPDLFSVTFAGQTVVALSQMFLLGIPPKLAAVWFGPNQVSSACSIGVLGNQLGTAIGFLVPPVVVKNHDNLDDIGHGLFLMFLVVAIICSIVFLLIVFLFTNEPPLPPSAAAQRTTDEHDNFIKSIVRLVKNKGYMILLVTYGINVGVYYAISTLLNPVVLAHFPDREKHAGGIGVTIVISGMFGSVACGLILDKTHKFKETTMCIYFLSFLGMVIYTGILFSGYIEIVYIVACLLGFFMTGYLPVGFEFAAELTFPESEGTSSGLLNASVQLFGILFTMMYGWILNNWQDLAANMLMVATLAIGMLLTMIIKADLRRQAANSSSA